MPESKLNYFATTGKGEPARLLFAVAGVPFTDNILSKEEWAKVKNDSKLLFSIFGNCLYSHLF